MNKTTDTEVQQKPFASSLFDTVKVRIRLRHRQLYELKQQHSKRIVYANRQYMVRGRFKGTFAIISSEGGREYLCIEGSIPKFLTGQNLVGHEDLKKGAIELIEKVLRRAHIQATLDETKAYRSGDFELLRVDYANHLCCGNQQRAEVFMEALRRRTASKPWEYSAYNAESLYWGQHSSRVTLKAYDKGREIGKHPFGPRVRSANVLARKALGLIRFELSLRADELTRLKLRKPEDWTPERARSLLDQKVAEVLPPDAPVPNVDLLPSLPRSLRDKLELWLRGAHDAFSRYPGSYAANKRKALELTGIDISSVLTVEEQAKAFESIRTLFKKGWRFHAWEAMWEKMKKGNDS